MVTLEWLGTALVSNDFQSPSAQGCKGAADADDRYNGAEHDFASQRITMDTSWKVAEGPTDYLAGKGNGLCRIPPRVLWSTGPRFVHETDKVLGFLEESLDLRFVEDWHLQRASFRRLIQWIYWNRQGTGWIVTIPHKPIPQIKILGRGQRYEGEVTSGELEAIGNKSNIRRMDDMRLSIAQNLPDLSLKGLLLAYGEDNRIPKHVRLYRELSRKFEHLSDGEPTFEFKDMYMLAVPDDSETIIKKGGITVVRHFMNEELGLYLCPHIHFCASPHYVERLDETQYHLTRFSIALRPDGRICHLIRSFSEPAAYLQAQQLDCAMLQGIGVVNA